MRNNSTWPPSAPSPIVWAAKAWSPWGIVLLAGGVIFCFIIVPSLYLVLAALGHVVDLRRLSVAQTLIAQAVAYVPLAAFLLLTLPRVAKTSLRGLGFRTPQRRDVAFGVCGIVVMWIVVTFVGTAVAALTHKQGPEAAITLLRSLHTPAQKAFFAFLAIALAPMLEEMTFRVFVFNALWRYVPYAWAALLSGAIFGVAHASPAADYDVQLITVSVSLALGGIVLAYVYAATRCYWSSVISHAGFNAISVVAVLFFHAK